MTTGLVNHIALAVTDKAASAEFYAPLLAFLGYERAAKYLWRHKKGVGDFILYKTARKYEKQDYRKGMTGIHHLAFNSDTQEEVDQFYQLLLQYNVNILNAPDHYTYSQGYYAVYFKDPDGIKIELAYTPDQCSCTQGNGD